MSSADKKVVFTEKEAQVLATAWICFKTHPDIDFEKLADLTGYTNPRSVQNVINAVKKKVAEGDKSPTTTPKSTKSTTKAKTTPGPRKRKVSRKDEDDGSDLIPSTPSKRARGMKRTLSKETVDDDDDSAFDMKDTLKEDANLEEDSAEGVVV
ncbi:hypothetical protein F4811DRAFT_540148 [Daldinia bambusicola]|nr:hypothetical protein F4811DRAFT_540148 [Daldinia bambusicola]